MKITTKSLLQGLFFVVFLALFVLPVWFTVISPLLQSSSTSTTTTPTFDLDEHLSQIEQIQQDLRDGKAVGSGNNAGDRGVLEVAVDGSSGHWWSYLSDLSHTISPINCIHQQQQAANTQQGSPYEAQYKLYQDYLPGGVLFQELYFFDMSKLPIYQLAYDYVQEAKYLLAKKMAHRNKWIKTVYQYHLFVETAKMTSTSFKSYFELKAKKATEAAAATVVGEATNKSKKESNPSTEAVEGSIKTSKVSTKSEFDEFDLSFDEYDTSECHLVQRSFFNVTSTHSIDEVFAELASTRGLELLIHVKDKKVLTRRPLMSFEWNHGSIDIFYVPLLTLSAFQRKELIFVRIVDEHNKVMVIKSFAIMPREDHQVSSDDNDRNDEETEQMIEYIISHAITHNDADFKTLSHNLKKEQLVADMVFALQIQDLFANSTTNKSSKNKPSSPYEGIGNNNTIIHDEETKKRSLSQYQIRILRQVDSSTVHYEDVNTYFYYYNYYSQWMQDYIDQHAYFTNVHKSIQNLLRDHSDIGSKRYQTQRDL